MADVQPENGFTRIAHEILENMAKIKLSPTQYRLIFVIWRYTYGFKRKEHDLSLNFLTDATGCDRRQIQRDLKRLEDRNIIFQDIKNGSYRKISFNKNYNEWDSTVGNSTNKSVGETTDGNSTHGEIAMGETINTGVGETTNKSVGETTNQDRYIDNSIDINNKKEESASEFYQENGFGHLGGYSAEMMMYWMNKLPESVIILAMKEAVKRDARNWKYLDRVLNDWKSRGFDTKEKVEAELKRFEQFKMNKVTFLNQSIKPKKESSYLLDKYREV